LNSDGLINNTVTFSGFSNLVSGGNADSFSFEAGGSVSGIVNGGGSGNLTINTTANVNLQNDTGQQLNSGSSSNFNVYGMTRVTDTTASSTITGASTSGGGSNSWTIDGQNSGNVNVAATSQNTLFSGFNNLVSGGNDTFNLTASTANNTTGSIDGFISGAANDHLQINLTTGVSVQIMDTTSDPLNINALNEYGIGNLDATGSQTPQFSSTATLIGDNFQNNVWNVNGKNSGTISDPAYTYLINFTGFSNLTTGKLGDTFNINNNGGSINGQVTGLIDGQGAATGAVANLAINTISSRPYSLSVLPSIPSQLENTPYLLSGYNLAKTSGVATIISNIPNYWVIDGHNVVYLNGNQYTLSSATNNSLIGGIDTDTFVWKSGYIDGSVNGGGGVNSLIIPLGNSGTKTVLIGGSSGASDTMSVTNIQNIVAQNGAMNTLAEANNLGVTTWNIMPVSTGAIYNYTSPISGTANSGTVSDGSTAGLMTFVGFNILKANPSGGSINEFNLQQGGDLSGYVYGAGQNDQFNFYTPTNNNTAFHVKLYSADPGATVTPSSTHNFSLYNVGQVFGGDTATSATSNYTITGFNDTNTDYWTLDGQNSGSIASNGSGSNRVVFSGFGNLVGNSGDDRFNVQGGSYTGFIYSNGGANDQLNVAVTAASSGQINYNSNGGSVSSISLTGNSDTGTYVNNSSSHTILYANGVNNYSVTYSDAQNVDDSVTANNYTISALGLNDNTTILDVLTQGSSLSGMDALSFGINNSVGTALGPSVNLLNKSVVTVSASGANDIVVNHSLSLPNTQLVFSGRNITELNNAVINANTLTLENLGTTGSAIALNTNVTNLSLNNVQRDVTIDQTGSSNANINITALNMANPLTVSVDGDINFTGTGGANSQLNLLGNVATSNFTVNNSGATDLGQITAAVLTVSSTGTITNSGQITSGATANFNAAGNDILLTNSSNDFQTIGVDNNHGGAVDIVDVTGIGLLSLNGGSVSISAGNAITDANSGGMNISANSVTLNAKNGIGGGGVNYTDANGFNNVDFTGAIHTATSNLSVINQNTTGTGAVNIDNSGDVMVTDLRNNGDIVFKNSGTIDLDGSKGAITADYPVDNNSASLAGITTFPGSIAIYGTSTNSLFTNSTDKSVYDIVAENLLVRDFVQFGTSSVPIRMLVHNQATLIATTGGYYFPYPPKNLTKFGDLKSISGFQGLAGQQLIDIESLGEVDPAIFTKVRNYNHEDVAILMPEDQRLDEDECTSDNKKKCKKQQQQSIN